MSIFSTPDSINAMFKKEENFADYLSKSEKEEEKKKFQKNYERFTPTPQDLIFLMNLEHQIKIVVVSAYWCFDCQVTIPILAKLTESSHEKVSLLILKKEDNQQFLVGTNGGERIPIVYFLSFDGFLIERWIERPTLIYQYYGALRKKMGWENDSFTVEYRKGYLDEYEKFSRAIAEDIKTKLERTEAIMSSSSRIHKSQ